MEKKRAFVELSLYDNSVHSFRNFAVRWMDFGISLLVLKSEYNIDSVFS